jgi:hypothetical protein
MERVEHPDLPFAVEVEPGQDRRSPQQRIAGVQGLLVQVAKRKVKGSEIAEPEDARGCERPGERSEQRDRADRDYQPQSISDLTSLLQESPPPYYSSCSTLPSCLSLDSQGQRCA